MDSNEKEWLMTNSSGSFAMGNWDRVPRRKYHGLWISRALGNDRLEHLLLDVLENLVTVDSQRKPLVNYDFGQGAGLEGRSFITEFQNNPLPTWYYDLPNQMGHLTRTLRFCEDGSEGIEISYDLSNTSVPVHLTLEPLFTLRNAHSLASENLALDGTLESIHQAYSFQPYDDLPKILIHLSTAHQMELRGTWYRNIYYREEEERGYPASEDCFRPARFTLQVTPGKTVTIRFSFEKIKSPKPSLTKEPQTGDFYSDLGKALDTYVYEDLNVHEFPHGFQGVIAGFPWFSAWARDTFISLPGLSLHWNDPTRALRLLKDWAPSVEQQLFGKKDLLIASSLNCSGLDSPLLWGWALRFMLEDHPKKVPHTNPLVPELMATLERWMVQLFQGECSTVEITDFGFFCKPGNYASSWMDAMVGGTPVTPRHGYPVDINILFFENLDFLVRTHTAQKAGTTRLFKNYLEAVHSKYFPNIWIEERGFIADGHDGVNYDGALRPNQLWALRSQLKIFTPQQAESALKLITNELLTPIGLKTLSPLDSRYRGKYWGEQTTRDQTYHQGTVWPWLLGIYTDASLKILGSVKTKKILAPVLKSLEKHFYEEACIGHVSEIFDGDSPHFARGAPAQAWSVAETLRVLWLLKNSKS